MNWNLGKNSLSLILGISISVSGFSQSYSEGFEDLANLTDWFIQNNSSMPDQDWGGGDNLIFPAQAGSPDSYIAVSYQSSSSSTPTTLSN